MNLKKTKKVVCLILLLCLIVSNITPVFAVSIGNVVNIVNRGNCGEYLTYTKNGTTIGVETFYVGFYENGVFHPAYCLDIDLQGVNDEIEYGVTVGDMSNIENNQALWRVMVNAFPYKTPQEMGLETEEQAFMVTKQAIYRVIDGASADNYGGKNEMGEKMVAKIKELVDIGRNGTQTYQDPVITISKVNSAGIDEMDDKYISQTFKINSQVDMESVQAILNKASAPEGTYIADLNNNPKTTFNKGETFKVLVPRSGITDEISVPISFNGNCKVYPILFGKSSDPTLQDYLLTTDPYIMSSARVTMDYIPGIDIEIEKIASEDNPFTGHKAGDGIDGVAFNIQSEDGTYNNNFVTTNGGKIKVENLKVQNYIVTELDSADYFVKGENTITVEPKYDGDNQKIIVENTPVNIVVDVEKEGPTEAEKGEVITYNFNNIGNFSNTEVSKFIWGDELPRQVTLQSLETGTWNEELNYKVQYITNRKSSWTDIGEYSTLENNIIDFTKIELLEGEYIKEFRLCFGTVKEGFTHEVAPKVIAKVNEDVQNNKIFVNNTYVTAIYQEIELKETDETHTVVYTKEEPVEEKLPKTGF